MFLLSVQNVNLLIGIFQEKIKRVGGTKNKMKKRGLKNKNIIFGLGRARRMIGQYSKAAGWFRRSSYQVVDLDTVEVKGEIIKSYTRFWGILAGILLLILGIILFITKSSSSCPLS